MSQRYKNSMRCKSEEISKDAALQFKTQIFEKKRLCNFKLKMTELGT